MLTFSDCEPEAFLCSLKQAGKARVYLQPRSSPQPVMDRSWRVEGDPASSIGTALLYTVTQRPLVGLPEAVICLLIDPG